jgi:protein-tyrosine phosphatase
MKGYLPMQAQIYWIDGPWPGKIGIIPRPRGGDWLNDEMVALKHLGLDVVVSLLTATEQFELELVGEQTAATQQQLQWLSYPIPDRGVPASALSLRGLVVQLTTLLAEGTKIGVHCRQGVGRSSLVIASLLAMNGISTDEAFARIAAARGVSVPDTPEQRHWVEQLMIRETRKAA